MTLIATYITGPFVIQASDRLVTRTQAGVVTQVDPEANKTVLFVARNANIAMSFTGVAYLDGRPTDQWIAETLQGYESRVIDGRAFSEFGHVHASWPDIGQAMRLVANRLTQAWLRLPQSHQALAELGKARSARNM